MSDLRKNLTSTGNSTGGKSLSQSFRKSMVQRPGGLAVPDNRTSMPTQYGTGGAIGFIIDATGSREDTWREAQSIQKSMFEGIRSLGQMRLRLMHFGGGRLQDHPWTDKSEELGRIIDRVRCEGGNTQINEALEKYVTDPGKPKPDTIILVGDSFEENKDNAFKLADQLAAKGVKIFSFLEGNSREAEQVFRELARRTGGAFSSFGPGMPLQDLCRAVAVYSVGGADALRSMAGSNGAAARLTQGLLKLTRE